MPMRFELLLILWVTAAALSAATIVDGFRRPGELPLTDQLRSDESNYPTLGTNRSDDPRQRSFQILKSTEAPNRADRSLFPAQAPAIPVVVYDAPPPQGLPVLKGVVSVDREAAAIFSMADGTTYSVSKVGDSVGPYTLLHMAGEEVTLQPPSGEAIVIRLRGTGEAP